MSTIWQSVNDHCMHCKEAVGNFFIKDGKIVMDEIYDNWGCWQQVKGESKMNVLCRICQKKQNKFLKKQRKEQKNAQ